MLFQPAACSYSISNVISRSFIDLLRLLLLRTACFFDCVSHLDLVGCFPEHPNRLIPTHILNENISKMFRILSKTKIIYLAYRLVIVILRGRRLFLEDFENSKRLLLKIDVVKSSFFAIFEKIENS